MKTKKLITYMKNRSEMEGLEWGLEDKYIEELFNTGLRLFFGVELDNKGNLIKDSQEPYKGFLSVWEKVNGWLKDGYEPTDDDWNELNCKCGNH